MNRAKIISAILGTHKRIQQFALPSDPGSRSKTPPIVAGYDIETLVTSDKKEMPCYLISFYFSKGARLSLKKNTEYKDRFYSFFSTANGEA